MTPPLRAAELPDRVYRLARGPDPWEWVDQEISRYIFEQADNGGAAFAGIRYRSRLGDDLINWATFEPNEVEDSDVEAVELDDPDLLAVVEFYDLTMIDE